MALFRLVYLVALLSPIAWRIVTGDGAGLDPHGRPAIASSASCDEGNGLDPHGGCRNTLSFDDGRGIDPNG